MLTTFTDLGAMAYMVPLIISAFAVMIWGAADNLASYAGYRCTECGARFQDRAALDRHTVQMSRAAKAKKAIEGHEAAETEFKKAA